MPSVVNLQKRFFGAVVGLKKGKMKRTSARIKKAAESISMAEAMDYASMPIMKMGHKKKHY